MIINKYDSCDTKSAEWQVPFEWVPDLVGRRDVYLSNGFAYVPQSSLISVILIQFKQRLLASLDVNQHDFEFR
jgi:DNA primase large subunit